MINVKLQGNSSYHVTGQVASLLHAAFGFSPESITKTRWFREDDPRAHWFTTSVVPDQASAITWGETVVYEKAYSSRSEQSWFELTVHEQTHRSEIEQSNVNYFYGSYLIEGALAGAYTTISLMRFGPTRMTNMQLFCGSTIMEKSRIFCTTMI